MSCLFTFAPTKAQQKRVFSHRGCVGDSTGVLLDKFWLEARVVLTAATFLLWQKKLRGQRWSRCTNTHKHVALPGLPGQITTVTEGRRNVISCHSVGISLVSTAPLFCHYPSTILCAICHFIYLFFNPLLLLLHADGTCVIFLSQMKDTIDIQSSGSRKSLKTEIQKFSSSSLFIM